VFHEAAHQELGQDDAPTISHLLVELIRAGFGRADASDVLHRQHVASRRLFYDRGDDDLRYGGVELSHAPDIRGLVGVVELLEEAITELCPDRLEVEIRDQPEERPQQGFEVLEIGLDDLVELRVLNFDRHLAPIAQPAEMDLADGRSGEGLEVEILEEIIEVLQRPADLVLHDLGRHSRRLFLKPAQNLGNLGRQHALVKTEHLPDLHRCALHLAQGLGDAHRVADQVLGLLDLLGRTRPGHVEDLVTDDGRTDPACQPTELDEAPHCRRDHFVVGHQCRRFVEITAASILPGVQIAFDFEPVSQT